MLTVKRRHVLKSSAALMASAAMGSKAEGQATSFTPEDLKSTLTPFGALRAGNASGTIPAWTGELIPLPASYQPGTPRPDPFAGEKPQFTITSANMAGYSDKLPEGLQYMLQKFTDFRLDVYPTHRTAIAPQYVYDYTYKNAQNAQISADGNSISNAYGGIPFPIPTFGKQVLWNHLLHWCGTSIHDPAGSYTISSSGEKILTSQVDLKFQYPYYFENGETDFDGTYQQLLISVIAPPYSAGEANLLLQPVNPIQTPPRAWAYLPGQRRTRLAPQLEYDTPIDIAGGVVNWDESQMFYGPLDEYDCKLIGRKEMYMPYNMNAAWAAPIDTQLSAQTYNPDLSRWELHRVWVVEMTLAAGKRNVDARRVAYFDEDTWGMLACDIYDGGASLWKFQQTIPALLSDVPCQLTGYYTINYDFHKGDYAALETKNSPTQWQPIDQIPKTFFTPGQLAALAGGN